MATIEALRSRVRVRLEEATPAVWSDPELDECITGTLAAYASRFPREVTTDATVASGTSYLPFPDGAIDIQRVTLDDGYPIAWDAHGGVIHVLEPLRAGIITIWHTTVTSLADLPVADETLIVLGAVACALESRAVQDFKRGGPPSSPAYDGVINRARQAFDQAMDRRGRRLRVSSFLSL